MLDKFLTIIMTMTLTIIMMSVFVCPTHTADSITMQYVPTTTTAPTLTKVLILGDSITWDSSEEIMGMLNQRANTTVVVDARPSTGINITNGSVDYMGVHFDYRGFRWVDHIPTLMRTHTPTHVVVALGANDAFWNGTREWDTTMEKVYAIVGKGTKVYLVNQVEHAYGGSADHMPRLRMVNDAIARIDAKYSNVYTVDVKSMFTGKAQFFRDHVHYNIFGQVTYADMLNKAIK